MVKDSACEIYKNVTTAKLLKGRQMQVCALLLSGLAERECRSPLSSVVSVWLLAIRLEGIPREELLWPPALLMICPLRWDTSNKMQSKLVVHGDS